MSKQMLFSDVIKELNQLNRYIIRVTYNYPVSREIITWKLKDKSVLKITDRQIYIFNFL